VGGGFWGFNWEGVIIQNVLDNKFMLVFFFLQFVGVQPVEKEFDRRIFVLCGVVGSVGADGVCEGRFPVNGGFRASRGSVICPDSSGCYLSVPLL